MPLEVLGCGRNDRRSADDGIVRALASLARSLHVTFHLSMDCPLLRARGANLKPLSEKIGMKEASRSSTRFCCERYATCKRNSAVLTRLHQALTNLRNDRTSLTRSKSHSAATSSRARRLPSTGPIRSSAFSSSSWRVIGFSKVPFAAVV